MTQSTPMAPNSLSQLTLTRPDDWHLHVRDAQALAAVVPHTAAQFARAIIMPNLSTPVTTTEQALAYRERILASVPKGVRFEPLMTLYLTDTLAPTEIERAHQSGHVVACKLYPQGATTNSDKGVTSIEKIYPVLEAMQKTGTKLLVHGEVTDPDVDVFDREAVFIDRHLEPLRKRFPALKIVFEHITTQNAVQYVKSADQNLAATLTAHHLLFNRNALFKGGMRPHYYCLPVLKKEVHRLALVEAATSGDPRFFLGTDSAPHAAHLKEHAQACAGCYTAFGAMSMYAEIFERLGRLDRLEGFASHFGPDFYELPRNTDHLTLVKAPWVLPESFAYGDALLKPLMGGETLAWQTRLGA